MLDFLRVAAAVPPLAVGDVKTNTAQILNMAKKAHEEGAQVVVFPELSLCGYTCGGRRALQLRGGALPR